MPVELQVAFGLISTITVVGGFGFAAFQFVAFVRQRRQETALTLNLDAIAPGALLTELVHEWAHRLQQDKSTAMIEVSHSASPPTVV